MKVHDSEEVATCWAQLEVFSTLTMIHKGKFLSCLTPPTDVHSADDLLECELISMMLYYEMLPSLQLVYNDEWTRFDSSNVATLCRAYPEDSSRHSV